MRTNDALSYFHDWKTRYLERNGNWVATSDAADLAGGDMRALGQRIAKLVEATFTDEKAQSDAAESIMDVMDDSLDGNEYPVSYARHSMREYLAIGKTNRGDPVEPPFATKSTTACDDQASHEVIL